MNATFRRTLTILAVAGAAFHTVGVHAQCTVDPSQVRMQEQSWSGTGAARMMNVDWHDEDESVVGFWNATLTAKGTAGVPDGTVIDVGLQQWHADGTEFLNSSAQHPATQNFCMGTWKRVGPSTYALNHFAYNFDAAQNKVGLTRIEEVVRVDGGGDHFVGTFRIRAYDTTRNVLADLKGTVTAFRITLDTTANEVH